MCRTQCVLVLVALYVGLAHSWDISLSMGDQLVFYTNGTKSDIVRFNSQNLAALAYDEIHNMMLYVDKQSDNDALCGYNLSSMEYKYFTERSGRNIMGIAFDPATESLFFSDSNERSINWISLKPGFKNNVYGNLLIQLDDGIPGDIAVDSCRGYIYWINTNMTTTPTIERARFNGSEREIVIKTTSVSINTTYKLEPHSLAIDQQTQKIFWIEHENIVRYHTFSADLNGKNKAIRSTYTLDFDEKILTNLSNTLTVSKNSLISLGWCSTCHVWKEFNDVNALQRPIKIFKLDSEIPNGIAANYTIKEQIMGIKDCEALTRLVRNNSVSNNSMKIATEYDGPFCVHGVKFNGQSRCKCTPGYTGQRCDVSVCELYCLQGDCSFNDEGLPTCSCNAGYSGERCEVNSCHGYCLNSGDCSLNNKSEPVCHCKRDYVGDRCEVSNCLNYCIQGECSFNEEGLPTCRCNAGYFGERCEVHACYGYCLNNGDCSLNEEDEPVCQCVGNQEGTRCEADMKNTFINIPTYYPAKRNLTLADLLSNWRKPTVKMSVTVEL